MTSYLATIGNVGELADNLRAARAEVGGGSGGDTYLKVNKGTGDLTFGPENTPLPPNHRFVVGLHDIHHGYLVSTADKQVTERRLVPMAQGGQRPIPPGGHTTRALDDKRRPTDHVITLSPGEYGTFEGGGPRNATEMGLSSIDEPGLRLVFTAWGPSNANRIGNLLDKAVGHLGTVDGQVGFIHPVVVVKSGSYDHKDFGKVHHVDFDVVDWLHTDGKTLLSVGAEGLIEERAPWDDDEPTDREREFLNAS